MDSSKGYVEKGIASWYGTKFHGRRTSSGETYDMYAMTAAHKSLPLPTYVRVTNLNNKKFEITNSIIILDKISKEKIEKSARNIPNIKVTDINHFSAFDLVKFKKVVLTESSVKELEKRYS